MQRQEYERTKALQAAQAARFARPPVAPAPQATTSPTPTTKVIVQKEYVYRDYGTYYRDRDDYYSRRNYNPPSYVYAGSPSYGSTDSIALWMALDNLSDMSMMMYLANHDSAGYQAWRNDAAVLAKDNAELKSKLDELDKKLSATDKVAAEPPEEFKRVANAASVAVEETEDAVVQDDNDSSHAWIWVFLLLLCIGFGALYRARPRY